MMIRAPGTVDFMPPEALNIGDATTIRYGTELDVFSFGCVMLHTLSNQWPTPSHAVIINPSGETTGLTEADRRSKYFENIDRSRLDDLIPLIKSCLSNLPKSRPSMMRVCDHLEGAAELYNEDYTSACETLRTDTSTSQMTTSQLLSNTVSKQCIVIYYHFLYDFSGQ